MYISGDEFDENTEDEDDKDELSQRISKKLTREREREVRGDSDSDLGEKGAASNGGLDPDVDLEAGPGRLEKSGTRREEEEEEDRDTKLVCYIYLSLHHRS